MSMAGLTGFSICSPRGWIWLLGPEQGQAAEWWMNLGRTVFSRIVEHAPESQLTYRESLRDIEACLRPVASKLYHMGLRCKLSRATLAGANESHDWRIFSDFAQVLIAIARPLYVQDPIGIDLDRSLYALAPSPEHS
jgi:hypothetical protein